MIVCQVEGYQNTLKLSCRHGVKVRPGPRDPGPPSKFKSGTRDPLKFKSGTPGSPSKFKSGTPGPPTNFKSGPS